MTRLNLNKLMEIPGHPEHNFFSKPGLSAEQVIEKLSSEIDTLHSWLINFGDRYDSTAFYEKSQLLIDKLSEREEMEKILEKSRIDNSTDNPFSSFRSITD